MAVQPVRIFLVEDEPGDAHVLRTALERGERTYDITHASSGKEFYEQLTEACGRHEPPDLIFLDLELPGMSGLEILRQIREGDACPHTVIIVLTSASHSRMVTEVYQAGANAFVTKPGRLADLDHFVRHIESFWVGLAKLPYR